MSSASIDSGGAQGLWLNPCFGASGDMMLGALAGLLDDPDAALAPLQRLNLDGWSVHFTIEDRNGLSSSRANVHAPAGEHGRHWSEIDELLASSDLPAAAVDGARHTFRRLAEIEAEAHGVAIDDVHFHEVGALDAIVDIVGSWLLFDALGLSTDLTTCGPVGLGHGTVSAAHGELPVPAPATLSLLDGWPTRPVDIAAETCTPTGAALLTTMASSSGPLPAGVIGASSRGAGGRNPTTHPNVLTAVRIERSPAEDAPEGQPTKAVIVETNLDDVTPETIGYVIDRALELGADDAWAVPIVMKKSRPGHQLRILTSPDRTNEMRALLARETGTLGTRTIAVDKVAAERTFDVVEVRGARVAIKVGPHRAKPEHDDIAAIARTTGEPLHVIADEALSIWRTHGHHVARQTDHE